VESQGYNTPKSQAIQEKGPEQEFLLPGSQVICVVNEFSILNQRDRWWKTVKEPLQLAEIDVNCSLD